MTYVNDYRLCPHADQDTGGNGRMILGCYLKESGTGMCVLSKKKGRRPHDFSVECPYR